MKASGQLQVAGARSGYDMMFDGMKLCAGCQDVFVLVEHTYCAGCARINEEIEARVAKAQEIAREQADEKRRKLFGELPGRVDAGVVAYPPPPEQLISTGQFVVLLAGWLSTAVLCGWAAWWAMRGMVALGLRLSQ